MGIIEAGIEGERLALDVLMKAGFKCFQPDWIVFKNGRYFIVEVKNQEAFEPPPFKGHGLPIWQVESRKNFLTITGIDTILLVKDSHGWMYQFLSVLEDDNFFDTIKSKRRIYPIDNFIALDVDDYGNIALEALKQ